MRPIRRLFTSLRRALAVEWRGPADLPRALTLEWRLVALRWIGLISVAPVLPLVHLSPSRMSAAIAILATATAYNTAVRHFLPRHSNLFANGYLTTIADSFLATAMVLVGGGFDSSFAYILFTSSISVAIRYGYGPSLAMTALFVSCDVVEAALRGQPPDAPFAFRSGFLLITVLLASYLRRLIEHTERALQERLDELQRLYADLAVAHQELLTLNETKTNFLANVSHELRTPLTSIRAFSEMLLSYDDEEAVRREFIGIISSESERLTRLVNDVLDVTRIEAGQMDWRDDSVNLKDVLESCARTFAPLLDASAVRFYQLIETDLPLVRADRDRLQQVVQNLLNNAMKFTSQGSITLRAGVVDQDVRVSVTDTGVGIAPADQSRVFEKFQQVGDTLTGKPKGSGLGLTICRDIVEHHGGRLTLSSTPGEGSTFSIWLPIPAASSSSSSEPLAA
jgi:signal transduction histidine kinase